MSKFDFTDPTDMMAGPSYREEGSKQPSGIVIHFRHLASGVTCEFKAFITDFEDAFESDWNETDVFGRMDDIQTYKKTKRKISISWTVPSHSQEEAISNFNEIGKMNTMQYPVYEDLEAGNKGGDFTNAENAVLDIEQIRQNLLSVNVENRDQLEAIQGSLDRIQQTILDSNKNAGSNPVARQQVSLLAAPPIVQMKFMNWAATSDDEGLYGRIGDFKFKPLLDEGVFLSNNMLIPMSCECSVSFTVIHTDKLGWDQNRNKRTKEFPYQLSKIGGV
jgi:hypothetical protein